MRQKAQTDRIAMQRGFFRAGLAGTLGCAFDVEA